MSATVTTRERRLGRGHRKGADPPGLRLYFWSVSLAVLSVLAVGASHEWAGLRHSIPDLAVWIGVTAVADLMPVTLWGTVSLSMSLPVTLAAGLLLSPIQAGLIACLGAFDVREFKGQISPARAIYNRSQVAASVLVASVVFHAIGPPIGNWPLILIGGLTVLAVDFVINMALVVVPTRVIAEKPVRAVIREVHGQAPREHAVGYLCLGLLAVLLATIVEAAGFWGLVCFLLPLFLARQMFVRGRRLEEAAQRISAKDQALVVASEETLEERRDERLALAGELHDEVLPPLFKVHLLGQVLRQDLNSGRLLDLDEDLPQLLEATAHAQSAIRDLVRDLRRSSLGPAGLNATIALHARQLESAGSPSIQLQLEDVGGSDLIQLLTYQVAREALNNASKHSRASRIQLRLWAEGDHIRLVIEDDGVGFDAREVDRDSHFGLQLISERIEAVGGRIVIDSRLGSGTVIAAALPHRESFAT